MTQQGAIRVRFAPSPTGMMHVGNIRTALFNWLFARHHGGKFILRIEDTDAERSTKEAIDAILAGLDWLGLNWDEGPFYQTQRLPLYQDAANRLLAERKAYRCYCTAEELAAIRKEVWAQGTKPKYDGRCFRRDPREDPAGRPHVLRFRSPTEGETRFHDLLHGEVVIDNRELDDLVIVRTDGMPTYNFAVVVDDASMLITHVIRGEDHLGNTARQIHLFRALGLEPPVFAHLPMILNQKRQKYSKRDGAASVTEFRELGYLPHAFVNYLARLGWSHGDQEVFSLAELIEHFDLPQVNKSGAIFDHEKLNWLNQHYLKAMPAAELIPLLAECLKKIGVAAEGDIRLPEIIELLRERAKTLADMAQRARMFFGGLIEIDPKARSKFLTPEQLPVLQAVRDELADVTAAAIEQVISGEFTAPVIEQVIHGYCEKSGKKLGDVAQPLRVALTGGTASPGIYQVIALLGRERALQRLDAAMALIPR